VTLKLTALVVAFGKDALLEQCLSAVERALEPVDGDTELVVVLNAASPAVRAGLEARADAVVTVEGGPDLGFTGGVAAGLEVARGEWVALVNDDCIPEVNALAELLAAGERGRDVGSVAAQIRFVHRPGVVNSAGIEVDDLGVARERRLGDPLTAMDPDVAEVFGASAALALYRRAMLDSVGVDASFFAYLDDADLAWRARMAGWRCLLAPRAVAYHHHSATLRHGSKAKHLLVGRNRVRMLAKNATTRQLRRRLLGVVAYDLLYVGYVAATARNAAPLVGRLRGLAEWKAYRTAGRPGRREISLAPSPGVRAALRRHRTYNAASRRLPWRSATRPTDAVRSVAADPLERATPHNRQAVP
jgi:GT2 family glycosyltransferase